MGEDEVPERCPNATENVALFGTTRDVKPPHYSLLTPYTSVEPYLPALSDGADYTFYDWNSTIFHHIPY